MDRGNDMDHQTAVQTYALEGYILDELSSEKRDAIEAHIFECTSCAEDVQMLSRFVTSLRAAFEENPSIGATDEQQQSFFRYTVLRFRSKVQEIPHTFNGPLHLPNIVDFRELFPEYSYQEPEAPPAIPLNAKRERGPRNHIRLETIPVGAHCTIKKPNSVPIIYYVRCSDDVFRVIDGRMPTPARKSRISFEIEVGKDGIGIVSAKNDRSDTLFRLACIQAETIPNPK
jgi:hypothetical protein